MPTLFEEISSWAGNRAAIYVGAKSFSALSLTTFRNTLTTSVGQVVSLAVPPFAVRFDSAVAGAVSAEDLKTEFELQGRDLSLRATDPVILEFSFGVLDAQRHFAKTLSKITLELRRLKFVIVPSAAKLIVSPAEAEVVPRIRRNDPDDFDDTLKQFGLVKDVATRVEGMLLYSGLATAITQSVGSGQQVVLKLLFPSLAFDGSIELAHSADKQFLFLSAAAGVRCTGSGCACGGPGNGIGPSKPGQIDRKPDSGDAQPYPVGTLTIGGPTPVKADDVIPGTRSQDAGDSGLFMPNSMAESLVDGPYPAARVDAEDNGFIGWKAVGIVDFSGFDFTPDPKFGRFYVDLKFRAEIYGHLQIDLGKLGKIRVTDFSAEQKHKGSNSLRIGFYCVIGTEGLFLKPVLEDLSFDPFEVSLVLGTLIGTPFGTPEVVAGYICDTILEKIISYQLPLQFDLELRRYMAKVMFPILKASYAAEIEGLMKRGGGRLLALYDGDPATGFLFSASMDR